MRTLPILSVQGAAVSAKLVNCNSCTACCEKGGLVYIENEEVHRLASLGVPIVTVDGVTFIKRMADGSCPMLDRERKKCSIYENRPLCCRLFPLDVLSINGKLQWAISNDCPEDRKLFTNLQSSSSDIGFGSMSIMARGLDALLSKQDIAYFFQKEETCMKVEFLETSQYDWTSLADCARPATESSIVFTTAKPESPKEKLKRKLKEKKKKDKKEKEKHKKESDD